MCDYGETYPNGSFSEGCISTDSMGVTLMDDGMLMVAFPSGRKGTYEMERRGRGSWINGRLIAIDGVPVTYLNGQIVPLTKDVVEQERVLKEAKQQQQRDQAVAEVASLIRKHGDGVVAVPIDEITKGDRIVLQGIIGMDPMVVTSIRTVSGRYRSLRYDPWNRQRRIDLGTVVYRLP